MAIKRLDNNWIKVSSLGQSDADSQNLMLKVLNNLRSGIDLFNKASIAGDYRRPSHQKACIPKLPQLTKRSPTEISSTIISVTQIDMNSGIEAYKNNGRISCSKEQNPQMAIKKLLKSSQGKRGIPVSRYNWRREKFGGVEMKGVVFRKKKPLGDL